MIPRKDGKPWESLRKMLEYMGRCSSSIGLNSENPLFWGTWAADVPGGIVTHGTFGVIFGGLVILLARWNLGFGSP